MKNKHPKAIVRLAQEHNLYVFPVNFNFQGLKTLKGYALCVRFDKATGEIGKDGLPVMAPEYREIITLEPTFERLNKWHCIDKLRASDKGFTVLKSLQGFDKRFPAMAERLREFKSKPHDFFFDIFTQ
jgi:hypothetical protein